MESELPFLAVQAETGNNNALTPPLISVGHNLGYENLVSQPKNTLEALCEEVGLSFEPGMVTYESSRDTSWALGDQTRITQEKRPVSDSVEKWKRLAAEQPQAWRVLSDYLDRLGPTTVDQIGYDFGECRRALEQRAPTMESGLFPLDWLIRKPYEERYLPERAAVRLQDAYFTGGMKQAARTLVEKVRRYVADRP